MASLHVALPTAGAPDYVRTLQLLAGLAVVRWFTVPVLAVLQQASERAQPVSMVLVALACMAALDLHDACSCCGRGAKERWKRCEGRPVLAWSTGLRTG